MYILYEYKKLHLYIYIKLFTIILIFLNIHNKESECVQTFD